MTWKAVDPAKVRRLFYPQALMLQRISVYRPPKPTFASLSANHTARWMRVRHGNLHVPAGTWIYLICRLWKRIAGRKIMCYYCSNYPYYQSYLPYQSYSPYQYSGMTYGYPFSGYGFAYYGLPLGYAYTYPSQPVYFAAAPQYLRGEHRVGNCLMICQ